MSFFFFTPQEDHMIAGNMAVSTPVASTSFCDRIIRLSELPPKARA